MTKLSSFANNSAILFGISSGIGYAITKSLTRCIYQCLDKRKVVDDFHNDNNIPTTFTDVSIGNMIQSKIRDYMQRLKVIFRHVIIGNNHHNFLLGSYFVFHTATMIGTAIKNDNIIETMSIMNGTLPLLLLYHVLIINHENKTKGRRKGRNDNGSNDDDQSDTDGDEDQRHNNNRDNSDIRHCRDTYYPKKVVVSELPSLQQQSQQDSYRIRSDSILTQTSELSTCSDNNNNNVLLHQQQHIFSTPKRKGSCSSQGIDGVDDTTTPTSKVRYLEMLVHNVSHTDLVLCLGIPNILGSKTNSEDNENEYDFIHKELSVANNSMMTPLTKTRSNINNHSEQDRNEESSAHALCRPRFSAFDMFCRRIHDVLKQISPLPSNIQSSATTKSSTSPTANKNISLLQSSIMKFPRYERSDLTPRFSLVTPRPHKQANLEVGFNLSDLCGQGHGKNTDELNITMADLQSLRLRGKDVSKLESFLSTSTSALGSSIKNNHLLSLSSPRPSVTALPRKIDNNNDDDAGDDDDTKTPLYLEAVFFPLLSSLLRRWSKQIVEKYPFITKQNQMKSNIKQVLILVTGVGTPRNWTHSMDGNSTQFCAEVMEYFIKILYPHITVVKLHSKREIFRYDENIVFAQKELLPCIDAYRDAHARGLPYPDETGVIDWSITSSRTASANNSFEHHGRQHFDTDWKQTFSVTLSFADGAPARTHAIQSALRPYRPQYYHFYQLKTFWHDSKICDDDIEVHSFESMETVPAMEVHKTSSAVQMVIGEMHKFREFFVNRLENSDNDLKAFWLRKSKKPVLAVLLVNKPGRGLVLYRGTNMEVSMPTGSLCAERNVIGTALAEDPGLRREDLMMVAVLAVPLCEESHESIPTSPNFPISPPPEVKADFCTTIHDSKTRSETVEDKIGKVHRQQNMRRSMSIGSFASIIECDDSYESDDVNLKEGGKRNQVDLENELVTSVSPINESGSPQQELAGTDTPDITTINSPMRKLVRLYSDNDELDANVDKHNDESKSISRRRKKRTVLLHSTEDINPLRPCGACNEWLKKIAESNPHFKIITFTDADMNGVYLTPCQE